MILSRHAALEFGSPVQPMTAEKEIVHWADDARAKANDMQRQDTRRPAGAQGQGCFLEYGTPNTAARAAEGSALCTTTSSTSAERTTWVNSRYRP